MAALALLLCANSPAVGLPAAATRQIEFTKDVEPILAKSCYSCHGAKKQESGLRLNEKAAALKGGDSFGKSGIVPVR